MPPGGSTSWTASFQVSAEGISEFGVYPVTAQLQDSVGDLLAADQTLLPFWPGQRPFPASVPPGGSTSWTASFQVSAEGISEFGVYPVTAQVQDSVGDFLAADQTLLPFWPGQRSAGLLRPLEISWLWPLIDQPHHQVCAALTNNDLAASLNPDGRLSALLTAGASHAGADLTWVIDPALLSDVATMTRPYQVGSKPNCTGAPSEPASTAAASWLAALKKVTPGQPTVITPYANVDMTALVHQGLTTDLATAYDTGDAVADSVLGGKFGHELAWPPGGTADLSVLTNLATAEHVDTVVLNSSEMPPADAGTVFQPDDAVTSLRVAGLPMNVLLSDDTLTGVLEAGDTSSGSLPKATEFAVRQRFLAETAMIAAEEPNSARTIVVAPPEDWSPSETLASDLLGETTNTPWLTPAPLGSLSSAPDTQRTVPRQPPPASKASPGELSRGYLAQVRSVGAQLGMYQSMLYKPEPGYVTSLDQALVATESAAWRDGGRSQGLAQAGQPVGLSQQRREEGQVHLGVVPGADGRFLRAGSRVDPERAAASGRPGQGGRQRGRDLSADHRPLPEPDHCPARSRR